MVQQTLNLTPSR